MKITSVVFASLFACIAVGCAAPASEGTEQSASKQSVSDCFALKVGSPEFNACVKEAASQGAGGAATDAGPVNHADPANDAGPANDVDPVKGAGPWWTPATGPDSCHDKCVVRTDKGNGVVETVTLSKNGFCTDSNGVSTGVSCVQ